VWKFFLVSEENDRAKCQCGTCDKVVKRDSGNTSNLPRRLQTNHPQYKELLKLEEEKQKEDDT
jgi:hypothetical protein